MLYANGLFTNRRSFVSLGAKLYLSGDDWAAQKIRVRRRDKFVCQIGKHHLDDADSPLSNPDHIVKKSNGGDDSLLTFARSADIATARGTQRKNEIHARSEQASRTSRKGIQ